MKKKNNYFIILPITVIIVSISMLFYIFENLENEHVSSFERNIRSLQKELTKVNDFLEIYGELGNEIINNSDLVIDFFNSDEKNILNYFVYDSERDIFHLDKIMESDLNIGEIISITGKGNLDFLNDISSLKAKEIYLALSMSDDFYRINEKISASHWVYYTSLNEFLSIRKRNSDFVSSDEFYYIDELLDMTFVTEGTKEKLKQRDKVFWTHPYIDLGGAGLMVTASYPIDYNGDYIASISVDFKSRILNSLIVDNYITLLSDDNGTIIATNMKNIDFGDELLTVDDLDIGLTYEEISQLEYNNLHTIKGSKIISNKIEGTPYTMYQIDLKLRYWLRAFLDLFPVLVFLVLFIIINLIYLKVRESEEKLKSTLKALESKQKELDYISRYDTLTDVYNRRGLENEISILYKKNQVKNSSLIIIDIDFFKNVNDTHGHDIGDKVLIELCKIIKNCVGEDEIVARYGGEEFIVICKDSNLRKATKLAEYLRVSVQNSKFEIVGKITISLGVSEFEDNDRKVNWFKNADNALYEAKKNGRNLTCYYKNNEIKIYSNDLKDQ